MSCLTFAFYIAWFLCLATTATAVTFTLFYSLVWGEEVAERWLSSILISNSQDIFIVEPAKVVLAVVAISFISTRTKNNYDSKEENEVGDVKGDDNDFLIDNPKERFKQSRIEAIREQTKKEVKLAGMLKEIVIHLIFMFFLAMVCYGNKNNYRFLMTTTTLNQFRKFDQVRMQNYITYFYK